jgi:hypothetical protein
VVEQQPEAFGNVAVSGQWEQVGLSSIRAWDARHLPEGKIAAPMDPSDNLSVTPGEFKCRRCFGPTKTGKPMILLGRGVDHMRYIIASVSDGLAVRVVPREVGGKAEKITCRLP